MAVDLEAATSGHVFEIDGVTTTVVAALPL